MRRVRRDEIVDYATYEDMREQFKMQVLALKQPRRIHLGEYVTLLFETTDTVRYQVQEMMRAEKIVRESEILHELETYNELLADKGGLGCTMLIEIDDAGERDRKLREWVALPQHVYAEVAGGDRVRATFDPRQVGSERVSAVQFLKFDLGGRAPISFGIDHPKYRVEQPLAEPQRTALASDLDS